MHRQGDALHGYAPKPRGEVFPLWQLPPVKRSGARGKGFRQTLPNGMSAGKEDGEARPAGRQPETRSLTA